MKISRPHYARMSDPAQNPQWRQRWIEPEERPCRVPATGGSGSWSIIGSRSPVSG